MSRIVNPIIKDTSAANMIDEKIKLIKLSPWLYYNSLQNKLILTVAIGIKTAIENLR